MVRGSLRTSAEIRVTEPVADPLIGRTVGQYEIDSRLGGGGMGVVYKARDLKLGRDVALKFLPQQWSHDEGAKQRFVREAQAASATHHPNICTIHDIGTAADGQLFIVMGYYDGPTLKERLEAGPLPIDEALDIATQAADGLAKAHAQGVVHRDIKPGNLILTEDGVRIVDFGLATFVDALQLTSQGSTLGTAAYMSPEQSRGEDLDARTDLWSLGVVLYEMLTGHPPFRGGYAEAIAYAIRHDDPPPIRAERPDVPEDVEQVVFRALHKERAVRFASGRDMARALRQARGLSLPQDLRTIPVDVHGIGVAAAAPPRRGRRMHAAALAAIVAGAVTASWLFYPFARVAVAVAPVANETGYTVLDPYEMALTEELVSRLVDSRVARVTPYERLLQIVRPFRDTPAAGGDRPALLEAVAAHTGAGTIVVPMLVREGNAWKARAEIRDARTSAVVTRVETASVTSALPKDSAYELTVQLAAALDDHFLSSGPRRAAIREWARRLRAERPAPAPRLGTLDAAGAFERGIDAYERMEYAAARDAFGEAAEEAPRNPLPLAWKSRVAALMRQDRDADESADSAARLDATVLPEPDRLIVAAAIADRRDPQRALARYEEIAARYPDEPTWLLDVAAVQDRLGQPRDAEATYQRALALDERLPRPHLELCRLYSPTRLNVSTAARQHGEAALQAYVNLANRGGEAQARWCLSDVLLAGGDDDRRRARQHAEKALAIMQADGYDYGLSRAYNYLGLVALLAERNGLEAAAHFERALSGARQVGNRFLEPRLLMNLGVSSELFGERERALTYYRESYALFEELGNQQEAAWSQANGAAILVDYGADLDRGFRDAQNALRVFETIGDRPFEVFAHQIIASYHRHLGVFDEALRVLDGARDIARVHNLNVDFIQVVIDQGRVRLAMGDYDGALELLREVDGRASGRDAVHLDIEQARALTGLGVFEEASAELDAAAAEIERLNDIGSLPLLYAARGELAYQSNRLAEARQSFAEGSQLWSDDLPEPASVEARAYLGLIDHLLGDDVAAERAVTTSLQQAIRMRQVALEARCRVFLARIALRRNRPLDAKRVIEEMDPQRQANLAPELRARVHHALSRALTDLGDGEAGKLEAEAAQRNRRAAVDLVDERYRASLLGRADLDFSW
jgi:tetratricopeptide (TPR) repeat protein/tRNA A-37 threonylcarbamoyl transferase component Bud32